MINWGGGFGIEELLNMLRSGQGSRAAELPIQRGIGIEDMPRGIDDTQPKQPFDASIPEQGMPGWQSEPVPEDKTVLGGPFNPPAGGGPVNPMIPKSPLGGGVISGMLKKSAPPTSAAPQDLSGAGAVER